MAFDIQIEHRIANIDAALWNELGSEQPFQSYQWYAFGEQVMSDCTPSYVILRQKDQPIARGTFYLVQNEPLPIPARFRRPVNAILRRWPLLICRSPLSNASGLLLPDKPSLHKNALITISQTGLDLLKKHRGSFLIFDYLKAEETQNWGKPFAKTEGGDPGTAMSIEWDSFEDFLTASKRRIRQHYKHSSREAANLCIKVTRHKSVQDINAALALIHNVERRHNAAPNPWARGMLENMHMVGGTWLEARIGERLVGCMLLLDDNSAQIAALPGLTDDVPFAYFMLLYGALQDAMEKGIKMLRWGSGAYETKRRLGFTLERNNNAVFSAAHPLLRFMLRLAK